MCPRSLAGRTAETSAVEGALFGQEEPVQVPDFDRVEHYLSPDGQIELDALAEAENDERWVVEVKWRLKRVGRGELEQLVERAESFEARPWCVSQAGFTPEALAFAGERGVLVSGADEVRALGKLVG